VFIFLSKYYFKLELVLLNLLAPHCQAEWHSTRLDPMYGIAESRLVITVAPQNDICPHGRTYPIKAVAITVNSNIIPMFHVSMKM
jgi:hypothetical protein